MEKLSSTLPISGSTNIADSIPTTTTCVNISYCRKVGIMMIGLQVVIVVIIVSFFSQNHDSVIGSMIRKETQVMLTTTRTAQPAATQQHQQDASVPPPPFLVPHTWWAAGHNARETVGVQTDVPTYYWSWTEETDMVFHTMYDSVMNPTSPTSWCIDNYTNVIIQNRFGWGLASRMRDLMDALILGLSTNRSFVHEGFFRDCPSTRQEISISNNITDIATLQELEEFEADPFMLCLFEPFSSCQGVSNVDPFFSGKTTSKGPEILTHPDQTHYSRYEDALIGWWDRLLQHGLHAVQLVPPSIESVVVNDEDTLSPSSSLPPSPPHASLDEKLAVFRSLMIRQTFAKVTPNVLQRVSVLEGLLWGQAGSSSASSATLLPMLTVHIRRTDKKYDDGPMLRHELQKDYTNYKENLWVLRLLISAAQRLSGGIQFQTMFLMSDEPAYFNTEISDYLVSSLIQDNDTIRPRVIYNDYVSKYLANNEEYNKNGHNVLNKQEHEMLDRELTAEMTFAAKYSSYIIGNGKSGISQFVSQAIGMKYRVSPETVSLFEDDPVLLEYLPETKDWSWLLKQ